MKYIAISALLLAVAAHVNAFMCNGKANLKEDETNMCSTSGGLASIVRKQSCLTQEIANNAVECTAGNAGCSEMNIQITSGQFSNTLMWSAASCFDSTMDIAVCSAGIAVTTTSGTAAAATTPAAASTTVSTAAAAASVSGGGAEVTDTTTEAATTAPTTAAPTGSTAAAPAVPEFVGCLFGNVAFNASCVAETVTVSLNHHLTNNPSTAAIGTVNVTIRNLGCCNTSECSVSDGITRSNVCKYGDESSQSDINCENECFAYLMDTGSATSVQFGCLPDIDLSGSSYSATTSCTSSHKDGSCNEANGVTECLKCCSGSGCNTWMSKTDFVVSETATKAIAATVFSSAAIITSSLFISLFL